MRKIITLVLALIMILSLAACKPVEPAETQGSDTTDPTVTDVPDDTGDETDTGTDTTAEPDETDEPKGLEFTEVNEIVYVYGADVLNVRKEASTDSEIMGEMKEGDQVTRIGYNEKWSIISYYGEPRYASSDFLTTHAPLEFDDKTDTVYIVAEGTLNLRRKPSPNADVVEYLPYGTKLDRTGIATAEDEFGTLWSRLLYNGQVCYASTDYLSEEAPAVMTEDDFTAVNEYVYVIDVEVGLYLRSLPTRSSESKVVHTASAGTKLLRIGVAKQADDEEIVWSKVIYNNVICYASSAYLTTEAPAEESGATTNTRG